MTNSSNDVPQAIDNTQSIVDKIEVLNLKKDILLPAFPVPKEFLLHTKDEVIGSNIIKPDVNNQWEYLKDLTYKGAKERYTEMTAEIEERLNFELFTIKTMGLCWLLFNCKRFHQSRRDMGVFVGPVVVLLRVAWWLIVLALPILIPSNTIYCLKDF
jgi:DNA polymerase-3 subunit alpha